MPTTPARSRLRRSALAVALTALALFAAPACSSSDDPPPSTTTTAPTDDTAVDTTTTDAPDPEPPVDDEEGSDDDSAADEDAGTLPAWAKDFETPGEELTTIEGENFRVDIYQVGTTEAPKDGVFVDPDTDEPILQEGDEVVFVNYVFTNTGKETIPLSYSLVDVTAEYADWKWMQGMDGISASSVFEDMGVLSSAMEPGSGDAPFAWEPGTTFAVGDNFEYQPGSAITFTATLVPSDDEGDLLHDERQEVEVETTIA